MAPKNNSGTKLSIRQMKERRVVELMRNFPKESVGGVPFGCSVWRIQGQVRQTLEANGTTITSGFGIALRTG